MAGEKEIKTRLIGMLNKALEMEHAAMVQYLSHAEIVDGINAEPIIARLKDNAGDETKHAEKFRTLIGDYLGGVPSTGIDKTYPAKTITEILETNLRMEKEAVDYYKTVLDEINKSKDLLKYEHLTLEHEVRHIIIEEQEHIAELELLLAKR